MKKFILLFWMIGITKAQEAIVSEITRHTDPTGHSAFVHHRRKFSQRLKHGSNNKEELTINYGILGGQFHFEKAVKDSKYGCYGQPDRDTTYYSATATGGYQTLTRRQFERVAHLFPLSCGGNLILEERRLRTAKLLADNQRMVKSIQNKLSHDGKPMQPTMVLLVPFCPNNDNEALTFLHQWRQHATPVNVAGYLFAPPNSGGSPATNNQ